MVDPYWQQVMQELRDLDADIRLIIIHPNFRNGHILLDEFLQKPAIYLRLDGENLLEEDLHMQFGIASDVFQSIADESYRVVLDECDRADPNALNSLLKHLLSQVDIDQVMLLSRDVPLSLPNGMRRCTRFVPSDSEQMLFDYAQKDMEQVLLEVRSFGSGLVRVNGHEIEDWDGESPRALFFYLVDRGMVTRDDIFSTFWSEMKVKEATNVFHVTKRKINEILGFNLVQYSSGYYRISDEIMLSYDVVRFTELIQNAVIAAPSEAQPLLRSAISLYRSSFLKSMSSGWVQNRREEMRLMYGEALSSLAHYQDQAGNIEEALGLYLRATSANIQYEEVFLRIMEMYEHLGMSADALQVYDRFVELPDGSNGNLVGSKLNTMADGIRQNQP